MQSEYNNHIKEREEMLEIEENNKLLQELKQKLQQIGDSL